MRTLRRLTALASLGIPLTVVASAQADPLLRYQVDQRGDFVLFGNTLGFECYDGTPTVPSPVVGTVECPNTDIDDSSPDIFWQSDDGTTAVANTSITAETAGSTAVLDLPDGAIVTYARIYWAGYYNTGVADADVRIERPGAGADAFDLTITAGDSWTVDDPDVTALGWYQSTADITDLVVAAGEGPYRVSDVASVELPDMNADHPVAAWSVVVFYELDTNPPEPLRNLALFDGLDYVDVDNDQTVSIVGFLVPQAEYDAKLGVVTYEGEQRWTGDSLAFNLITLSDDSNAEDNFFNNSRTYLGVPVSNPGDLPQLTGEPNSMGGVDMDVVDITPYVGPGLTTARLDATSDADTYLLAVFCTSITTYKPDFSGSPKTFVDLDGGQIEWGDELEYSIVATNTGNDLSMNTVLTDTLPYEVTLVPGSIAIDGVPMTDAIGDDAAEYEGVSRNIIARLGTGATGTEGGAMDVGASSVVTYRVTVNDNELGIFYNQATVTGVGAESPAGTPATDFPTDGNGDLPGSTRTTGVIVAPGDTDGDGLTDDVEDSIGTDKFDADSDDDGLIDGLEVDPTGDADEDGTINARDPDSDNDGLFDGLELGQDCSHPQTDLAAGVCTPDRQPSTTTDMTLADTDGGGVNDGIEDTDHDGFQDPFETDPTAGHARDDDTDGDGLSDVTENAIGTDYQDRDSDDDGVIDGREQNYDSDSDGDGALNALDPDSDNDGLFDGTELGRDCSDPGTDTTQGYCIPDADSGLSTTDPEIVDTDRGSVSDGVEDENHNGRVDEGERDPRNPFDDVPTEAGGAGGAPPVVTAGAAGAAGIPAAAGAAGTPAAAGAAGTPAAAGTAGSGVSPATGGVEEPPTPPAAGQGGFGPQLPERAVEGGGCDCSVPERNPSAPWGLVLALGALLLGRRRRDS